MALVLQGDFQDHRCSAPVHRGEQLECARTEVGYESMDALHSLLRRNTWR